MGSENEIAVNRDRNVIRIDAPPGTRIFNGDRVLDVDFDIISVGVEMFLADQVLDMAAKGRKGFRLIGFGPLDDE